MSADLDAAVERMTEARQALERLAVTAASDPWLETTDTPRAVRDVLAKAVYGLSDHDTRLIHEYGGLMRAYTPEAKPVKPSVVWTRPRVNRTPHAFVGPEPERGAWLSACGMATMPTGAMVGALDEEHEHCAACARAVGAL